MTDKDLIAMMQRQINILTTENTELRNTMTMQEKALGLAADTLISEQNKVRFLQTILHERRCLQ